MSRERAGNRREKFFKGIYLFPNIRVGEVIYLYVDVAVRLGLAERLC